MSHESELDIITDLQKQHEEFERHGYDGHNRRSGFTTMHDLRIRKIRRIWRGRLHQAVTSINLNRELR